MTEMRPRSASGSRFPAARPRIGSNRSTSYESMQDTKSTNTYIENESSLDNSNETQDFKNEESVDQTDFKTDENKSEINDDSSKDTDLSEEEDAIDVSSEDQNQCTPNKSDDNAVNLMVIVGFVCLGICAVAYGYITDSTNLQTAIGFDTIKKQFPTQSEDLWVALESGVQDIVEFKKPSTFILLYKEEAEDTLSNLLAEFSRYVVCNITKCSHQPITITDTQLNSPEILADYGIVIERYRTELQEKGVMIVKNLENVRGVSAQAFHSFCDEIQPLVKRSLIIFTMKVDELRGRNNMKFVEEYLQNKWTDIKTSALNALITRITSMVLEVVP